MNSRKHVLLLIVLLCFGMSLYAQSTTEYYDPYTPEPLLEGAPKWMEEIVANPKGVNFFAMMDKYEQWMASDVDARVKTIDNKQVVNFFRRWKKAYEPYVDSKGNIVLPTKQEYLKALDANNAQLSSSPRLKGASAAKQSEVIWRNIGPNQTWANATKTKDYQACIFRIDASLSNPNILYCGAETGVVFKTTDKGENWTACNGMHNFGGKIYALTIHPTDPNVVFVGGGSNLWKTVDGGQTWVRKSTIFAQINSIRISKVNPDVITAATSDGFYRSVNGGDSFVRLKQGNCWDHELKPDNPNCIYLLMEETEDYGLGAQFYVSTDAGSNFVAKDALQGKRMNAGRLAVCSAPNGANYVYALVTEKGPTSYIGGGASHILQSTDAGNTWTDKTTRNGVAFDYSNSFYGVDYTGGQGFFDMTLGVSPQNPEHVIFGLCNAYRSTQGGAGASENTIIGGYTSVRDMHPDIQDIVSVGSDTWIVTDGGVQYSSDFFATQGQNKMKGIYASDYHGFDVGWNEDIVVGGRWHNGDAVYMPAYGDGSTLHVGGVEQATGHVFVSDPKKVYFSDVCMYKMGDGLGDVPREMFGGYFSNIKPYEQLKVSGRIVVDPRYAQRILMNGREGKSIDVYQMYMSENEGITFTSVHDTYGDKICSYEISRSNPQVMYVSGCWSLYRSEDGGQNWEEFENPFPQTNQLPIMMAIHPNDDKHIWVVASFQRGGVKYSTDGGETWQSPVTATIADENFFWVVLVGDELNGVYLATDNGAKVYYKDDSLTDWVDYSYGLNPGMRITRMVPFYKEGKMRIGSNQGFWEAPLYRQDFRPVAQPIALNLGSGDLSSNPQKVVQLDSYSIVKQEPNTKWEWTITPAPQMISDRFVRNPTVVFGGKQSYDITLKITTPQGKTHSRTIKNMVWTGDTPTGIAQAQGDNPVKVNAQVLNRGEALVLSLDGVEGDKVCTLHSHSGKLLHTELVGADGHQASFSTASLSPGWYIYEVKTHTFKSFGRICIK